MSRQTITFRIDSQKKKVLDALAAGMERDRSYLLNEAVSNYLEVHQWQVAHIKEGLRQADADEFARDSEVISAFARCLGAAVSRSP